MPKKNQAQISTRKLPKQARSNELVSAILDAAVRVLGEEGAQRFTTARVAERAGVSVGSLYQYFPNKAAILFRLQSDEWRETTALLREIVSDQTVPPATRLRSLVRAFVQSECEEASMRVALSDAAPLYRDAPEAHEVRDAGEATFHDFLAVLLPDATPETLALTTTLVKTTMGAGGKQFSEEPRSTDEIEAFSGAMADMFIAHIDALNERAREAR